MLFPLAGGVRLGRFRSGYFFGLARRQRLVFVNIYLPGTSSQRQADHSYNEKEFIQLHRYIFDAFIQRKKSKIMRLKAFAFC